MAVTVRGKTGELGATSTNRLVNISDFFTQQVRQQQRAAAEVARKACTVPYAALRSCVCWVC
jgi:hypothetical protein